VIVLSEADYLARLEQLPRLDIGGPSYTEPALMSAASAELLSLAAMGERVAVMKGCMRCHTADGTPHIGPTWLGLYRSEVPLANGERRLADEAYLTESMMDPMAEVHLGFRPVMPAYQGLLSAAETGALVEYIRYLSTRSAATRLSPLAPRGSPSIQLPVSAPEELDRHEVPTPIGGGAPPRPDGPPYPPLLGGPPASSVEALP
jgi:cytochrome c oxidase subunit 2